jgi:mRNA-degrading endonuclease YafQ of YafQ-DinJ toxin-antitoxin module
MPCLQNLQSGLAKEKYVTGSPPFSIEESDRFKRSFKKLAKVHKTRFVERVAQTLEELIDDPYPNNSRHEPLL